MAKFRLTAPGGAVYEVDAPDENAAVNALSQIANPNSSAPTFEKAAPPAAADQGALNAYVKGAPLGLPFGDRLLAAGQTLGARFGTGDSPDYGTNLDRIRAQKAEIAQDHPGALLAGQLTGAAVGPVLGAKAAQGLSSLGSRVFASGGVNAGAGAVQGLSDAPDWTNGPDTAKHVAMGAGTGFFVGAGMPVLGKGIGLGYNAVADKLAGGAPGISSQAASHLLPAMQADGPSAVTAALDRYGPNGMLLDAGPALLGKAQGASLNSDEGRSALVNALTARKQGANARIQGLVDSNLGPAEDPVIATQNILDHRSTVDAQNYGNALRTAPPVDTTGVLALIGQRLNTAEGMQKKALQNLKTALMQEKEFPVLNPDGTQGIERRMVPKDQAENLHNIRQEIDNVVNYDAPGLGVPAGALQNQQGALKQVRGSLDEALKQQVPGMADADALSSALAKRADAVKLGTSVLDSGKTAMTPERLQQVYDAMSPGERAALAKGTRGEIERQLDTKANDLVAGKNVIKGEGDWNRARLGTVFGQEPTDAVIGGLDTEAKFADSHNKIVENSQTAQRTAAARAMRPEPASETPLFNPNSTLTGMTATVAKKAAQSLVNALMKSDPTASYGEVAKILSAQGPERQAYVSALADALAKRGRNATVAPIVGDRSALAAALAGNAYLRNQLQSQ